ncbi:MAG TPA: TIM-barrel domain-containing protein, partial [Terriglobia bacterium]|nr:TIM-barrel domain-containing protein [Terriglobia bacterium]
MKKISNGRPKITCSRREAMARIGAASAGALLPQVQTQDFAGPADERGRRLRPLKLAGQRAALSITPVSPHTLRITVAAASDDGKSQALESDPVLVEREWPAPALQINSLGAPQRRPWGEFQIFATTQPLAIGIRGERSRIVPRLVIEDDGSVSFSRGVAPLFGLGEGGAQFDRGGNNFPPQNGQGPGLDVLGARVGIPLVVSADGWALFFHRPFRSFDLTGEEARLNPLPSQNALPLDFFLITSENPADIFAEYARLTGFPQLPPIWSLGYQQSHRTLASREEILSEAKTFRDKKLPCDLMIYLGTGF